MNKKQFVGLSLDGDVLKIAQAHLSKGKLNIYKLDRITLVAKLGKENDQKDILESNDEVIDEVEAESIFGIENKTSSNGSSAHQSTKNVLEEGPDIISIAESEVSEQVESNEILIHNLLTGINKKRVNLGLNIPSGSTIFQIIKSQNHLELKKKELLAIIEENLESTYGETLMDDHYAYEIRDDGALILASNDKEIELQNLIDQSKDLYSGKLFTNEILPEEAALIGLVRNNYTLDDNDITGIVNLCKKTTRLIFLKGNQVWSVIPLIYEGTQSKSVLGTIYSKILFQLDTGELPSLEKIILANNAIGENAISYFKKYFPDIDVEDLHYDDQHILFEPDLKNDISSYSTAIGLAWAAAGFKRDSYKSFSFLPQYIAERQKVFKLRWHGILFLGLIAVLPALFNYVYKSNLKKINNLSNEIRLTDNQIRSLRPLVIGVNELSTKYNLINQQLKRLNDLNKGTDTWGKSLSLINNGVAEIKGCWITTMKKVKGGLLLQGYSLYRNRIPRFTDLFLKANLQDVKVGKIKDIKVYKFTIMVQKVREDQTE